ncbi:MAG: hypothetical protein ACQERN_13740 [Thermodesulfobacteriota bacterium]
MFVYRKQLKDLIQHENHNNPIVSVYINLTPPRKYTAELNSMIHNARKQLKGENRYDKQQRNAVDRVFAKIETHVSEAMERKKNARMAIIFADADGFWQQYLLPVSLPSQIAVEPTPYTRPLSILLDEFERYLVLTVDSRKARIFSLYLGDFERQPDIFFEDEVPDRVRANLSRTYGSGKQVSGGLGDKRIQRHIEDHIQRHLKQVAEQTFDFFKQNDFSRLIIAGPDDSRILPDLKNHLHSYLKSRLAGEFHAQPDDHSATLRQKALEAAEANERAYEKMRINELFEKSGPQQLGVLGADPTIEALMLNQVHTLLIDKDFAPEGYVCPNDHILSTHRLECPLCGDTMGKTDHLADEMVEEAMAQGAEIEHIFTDHTDFESYGVGAILRFTVA